MSKAAKALVLANKAVLGQGLNLVRGLTDAQFVAVAEPWSTSSIGQHFRHVLDIYQALKTQTLKTISASVEVDFDVRRRGSVFESSTRESAQALEELVNWLDSLNYENITNQILQVRSEVSPDESISPVVPSTFLRELMFVGSHAVHHYALIKMLARMQGLEVDATFGIAPATLTDMRHRLACAP